MSAAAAKSATNQALAIRPDDVSIEITIEEPKKGPVSFDAEIKHKGKKGLSMKLPPGESEWPRMTGNGNYKDGSRFEETSLEKSKFQGDLTEKPPTAPDAGFILQDDDGRNADVAKVFDELLLPLEAQALEAMVTAISELKPSSRFLEGKKMSVLVPLLKDEDALRAKLQEMFSPFVKKNKVCSRRWCRRACRCAPRSPASSQT
jgi:hypothetical protein